MKTNYVSWGDSLEILKSIPDNSIDLVITPPPYFQQRIYSADWQLGREDTVDEYLDKLSLIFAQCIRICKDSGNIVFNLGDRSIVLRFFYVWLKICQFIT